MISDEEGKRAEVMRQATVKYFYVGGKFRIEFLCLVE